MENYVVKSNVLIQKFYTTLSTQQQKIILYLISQIKPWDEDFKEYYEFEILEFCRGCGIDGKNGNHYVILKKQLLDIRNNGFYVDVHNSTNSFSWIQKIKFSKDGKHTRGNGIVQIKLDEELKPFVLQLKDNFTRYQLNYVLKMKSKYAIRMYELVCSIHFKELEPYSKQYELSELKKILNAEKYTEFRDFKSRVLTPSQNEINKLSDKMVYFQPIKTGKMTTHIQVTVETKTIQERIKLAGIFDEKRKSE